MPMLSTHVLDTSRGCPAAGLRVELRRGEDGGTAPAATGATDGDGRHIFAPDGGGEFPAGLFELTFHVGDYFRSRGATGGRTPFLDTVPVRFRMESGQRYHVPLLVSPFGYTTYRGS